MLVLFSEAQDIIFQATSRVSKVPKNFHLGFPGFLSMEVYVTPEVAP